MAELQRNATWSEPGSWSGWKQYNDKGLIEPALSSTLDLVNGLLGLLGLGGGGGAVTISKPIFLDNLNVTPSGSLPTEVDVQLWAITPANSDSSWARSTKPLFT